MDDLSVEVCTIRYSGTLDRIYTTTTTTTTTVSNFIGLRVLELLKPQLVAGKLQHP